MTDPVQVVAEAPCIKQPAPNTTVVPCSGLPSKHPECVVAALKAAGALMPGDVRKLTEDRDRLQALYSDVCRLNPRAALLQEALSVLGRHKTVTFTTVGVGRQHRACEVCGLTPPCPEASLAEKIGKALQD